ncbi:MAG: heme A synthase [Gemmatimonadales bacterium]
MMRRGTTLAWAAAVCTYLLIVLGAVVRITGSGLGCGDHWPLCNGHLFPSLADISTVIEWSHRLVAALVSVLVIALAVADRPSNGSTVLRASMVAVALLVLQVLLGAITVKLELPAWSIVLHLGTAMLLLATLLFAATGGSPAWREPSLPIAALAFVTVLFGALTANMGAAAACGGFPLCNGHVWVTAGPLALIQWIHRLLAYTLAITVLVWAVRTPRRGPKIVLGVVGLQIVIGAATVLLGLPGVLQAAHVAVGAAVWAGVTLACSEPRHVIQSFGPQ